MKRITNNQGFTLIELICVMAMLAAVMTFSAPMLGRFFSGRSITEESRRFIALTRYARSEAISRSVLMELWIEPASSIYGLKPQVEYSSTPSRSIEFTLPENFRFDINTDDIDTRGIARILFLPDGAIDADSLKELSIMKGEEEKIVIVQAEFGLGYIIEEETE